MVDGESPAAIQFQAMLFNNIIHIVFGVYFWEIVTAFPVDWAIIRRKHPFRWPMLLYFACRYLMLLAIVSIVVALTTVHHINCQALFTFHQFAGNSTIGLATTLFMIRTLAVWDCSCYVIIPLAVISAGHWAVLIRGMTTVASEWVPEAHRCVISNSGSIFLDLVFYYTTAFDFLVLVLTTIGLYASPGRSTLWKLLFRDGVIYFVVGFLANMIPAVLISLNLSPVANIMYTVPAESFASMFACRSFTRVLTHRSRESHIHSSMPFDGNRTVGTLSTLRARERTHMFDSNCDFPGHTTIDTGISCGEHGIVEIQDSNVHMLKTFTSTAEDDKLGPP